MQRGFNTVHFFLLKDYLIKCHYKLKHVKCDQFSSSLDEHEGKTLFMF